MAQEEHVRAGVHLPEHPIHVERVAAQVEVEALRQHDLECVTCTDVLLGSLDSLTVQLRASAAPNRAGRERCPGRRRRREPLLPRLLQIAPDHLQALQRIEVDGPEPVGIPALVLVALEEHVVDERDALAPVVKGGELTDHRDDGVGMTNVVGRWHR